MTTHKKTAAQLEREIAEALTRTKQLGARQLDLLAQAASFGSVSVADLLPRPRTVALLRPERVARERRATARLYELVEAGMLEEVYGDKYEATTAGLAALRSAGFVPGPTGFWIKPGARRPGWTT